MKYQSKTKAKPMTSWLYDASRNSIAKRLYSTNYTTQLFNEIKLIAKVNKKSSLLVNSPCQNQKFFVKINANSTNIDCHHRYVIQMRFYRKKSTFAFSKHCRYISSQKQIDCQL